MTNECLSYKIKSLDNQVKELKDIYDIIETNNKIINRLVKYKLLNNVDEKTLEKINAMCHFSNIEAHKILSLEINILSPNFINIVFEFLDSNKFEHMKPFFQEYFLNHNLLEEIVYTLTIQKKNEKLVSKYGTSEVIYKKISDLLCEWINLIRSIDDIDYI